MWEIHWKDSSTQDVLASRVTVTQIFVFPKEKWILLYQAFSLLQISMNIEAPHGNDSVNIYYFFVSLVAVSYHTFSLGNIQYINPQFRGEVVELRNVSFGLENLSKFIETHSGRQTHWHVDEMVTYVEKYFEVCLNIKPSSSFLKARLFAEDFLAQSVLHVWQSILRNYTFVLYRSNHGVCSNGKMVDSDAVQHRSRIVIGDIYMRRYLHIPIQILNPINGSFRFVVCGMKGSEAVAFRELISAYDKIVWVMLLSTVVSSELAWNMLSGNIYPLHIVTWNFRLNTVSRKLYSVLKIYLEQGDITPSHKPVTNQKVRLFLGIVLVINIVLGNGHKNTNVYRMVAPRKPMRYK